MRGSISGISGGMSLKTSSNPAHHALVSVLDCLLASVIVAPLVVGYWRSMWELVDIYVYPGDVLVSALISTAVGYLGHLAFAVGQEPLAELLDPDKRRLIFYALSRIYTACFAFVCVNSWRGIWSLLNIFTGGGTANAFASFCVGLAALTVFKCLRNVSAVPFSIVTDQVKGYFEVPTMFRVAKDEKTTLYVLDCLFSVFVIGTLVVFVWRGAWVLLDIFLFPEDEYWSAWASLVLGYANVILAYMMQPIMRWICDRIDGTPRLLVSDVFLFFSFVGTINVWRGIWNLLNLYFIPNDLELSCWITHWACLILLILLKCSNTLLVRGVYIDAEEPAGKCVVFPIYYLRLMFQHERAKKISKKFQLESVVRKKLEMEGIKHPCTCGASDVKNHITGVVVVDIPKAGVESAKTTPQRNQQQLPERYF